MCSLVGAHFLQVLIERVRESCRQEVVMGIICQAGAVEGIFEVLEGKRIVEDVG